MSWVWMDDGPDGSVPPPLKALDEQYQKGLDDGYGRAWQEFAELLSAYVENDDPDTLTLLVEWWSDGTRNRFVRTGEGHIPSDDDAREFEEALRLHLIKGLFR